MNVAVANRENCNTRVEQRVNHKKWLRTTACARPCAWCHF